MEGNVPSAKERTPVSGRSADYGRLFELLRWAAIVFVGATIQLPTSHVYIKPGVYAVLAIAAVFNLVWNHALPKGFAGSHTFAEMVLEVIWITLLQLPTGQIHSPFYFLFALPILNAALVLDQRGVRLIGAISAILLIPVLFLHLWGTPLDLNHFFSYFVRLGLILICAFLGGLLSAEREG